MEFNKQSHTKRNNVLYVKFHMKTHDSILQHLNLLTIQTCHTLLLTIIDEDDLCAILRDNRGQYKRVLFYELYSELEMQAKSFTLENASQKKCSFTVKDLAFFNINKQIHCK